MKSFLVRSSASIVATALLLTCFNACKRGTPSTTVDETPDTTIMRPVPTPASEFEQKLKFARDAHFTHIFLHTNAPNVVDWLKVGDMKQFIAGSNFPIDPPQMALLQKRYKIEDYSGK
ncbi:MAG: hypothetical protein DMF70_00540 [Acidobacteria bacterium]|nr:MAG: hypothetical protein DMF70_00540 [Acidobacteriota bacterium]